MGEETRRVWTPQKRGWRREGTVHGVTAQGSYFEDSLLLLFHLFDLSFSLHETRMMMIRRKKKKKDTYFMDSQ